MNNYKSQGQTFEEAHLNLCSETVHEGFFIEDPFFKNHMEQMELLRKQRESGLRFDMEKVKKVVEDIDHPDLPEAIRNRTLVIDIDQVCAAHGAETAEQREALKEKIANMPEVRDINLVCFDEINTLREEFASFEILKGRSSTGRFDYPFLPDLHHMPRLNKTYMPPKDGDVVLMTEASMDWSRLEELCMASVARPDQHLSGEDPALEVRKHPAIFKLKDLLEDPEEFPRLRKMLVNGQKTEKIIGWKPTPIFIATAEESGLLCDPYTAEATMSKIYSLGKEFGVEIYIGKKKALKPVLYALMYNARKEDLNLTEVENITVEKAKELIDKRQKVAIIGGTGPVFGNIAKILARHYEGLTVCSDTSETWKFEDFAAISKVDMPVRDWEQSKLRRGKGHNKFKRKGKK